MSRRRAFACLCSFVLMVVFAWAGPPAVAAPGSAGTVPVQLLSITDFHGQLEPGSGGDGTVKDAAGTSYQVGGVAYLATHLKQLRDGVQNSILFSTGDSFSGWPKSTWSAQDEPTIEVLNQLGIEFSAVGNHELDVSRSFLVDHMINGECFGTIGLDSCFTDSTGERFSGTDFPYLTGNIVDAESGDQILDGTIVKQVKIPGAAETLPVGFINLTVPSVRDAVATERSFQPDLDSLPIIESANAAADRLRAEGVRAIVLNVHEGATSTGGFDACNASGPMITANAKLSADIDAIVTGHTHNAWVCNLADPEGQPRPIVQAASTGRLISEITLQLDPSTGEVIRDKTEAVNHPVTRDVAADQAMQRTVDYWVAENAETRGTPIAKISGDVTNVRTASQETRLGNLIADAYQRNADKGPKKKSDLALFMTTAGYWYQDDLTVAAGLEKGDQRGVIVAGDAWSTNEYASNILTVSLTGAALVDVLEGQWQPQENGSELFLPFAVSDTLRYAYDMADPLGSRIDIDSIRIDGDPIKKARTYRVTMPIRMIFGHDQFPGLEQVVDPVRNDRLRDAFLWDLVEQKTVKPPKLGRVTATGIPTLDVDGTAYLSDLPWLTAFSGWRSVERDKGVGGIPITLDGVRYAKGLGLGSAGEVNYRPGGRCSRLTATVGIDDYVAEDAGSGASSALQVYADGEQIFDSGVMQPGSTENLDVSLAGVQSLMLRVTTGGDGTFADRAAFADAKITCGK